MKNKKHTLQKKVRISFTLMMICSFAVMPFVSASTIDLEDTSITIKIYNVSKIPKNNSDIIIKVEMINNQFNTQNSQNFTFTIFNNTLINENKDFNLFFVKNSSVGQTIVEQYTTCLTDKSKCENDLTKWDLGWSFCKRDLEKAVGENSTKCNKNLDACNLKIKEKDLDLSGKNSEISTLKSEKENTKNSKWFYGLIGIILGIVGFLFYEGRIGKGNPKDKSMEEFSKSQAG